MICWCSIGPFSVPRRAGSGSSGRGSSPRRARTARSRAAVATGRSRVRSGRRRWASTTCPRAPQGRSRPRAVPPASSRRHCDRARGAPDQQPRAPRRLLDTEGEADFRSPALHRHTRPAGRSPGRARVDHVVDGDSGLADLALPEPAGRSRDYVPMRFPAPMTSMSCIVTPPSASAPMTASVAGPPCPCRGASRTWSCGFRESKRHRWPCQLPSTGSKPKPTASVPSSSVPAT